MGRDFCLIWTRGVQDTVGMSNFLLPGGNDINLGESFVWRGA